MESVKPYTVRKIIGGLYVAFILTMSLVPGSTLPEIDPSEYDVLSHFTAYFIMMLWYARIYPPKFYPRLAVIIIFIGVIAECMQGLVETREFQAIDILFNSTGIVFAWLFSRFYLTSVFSK